MGDKLRNLWESIRTSLWLIPSFMVILAIMVALFALEYDYRLTGQEELETVWFYTGSPEAARAVLSVVAGSMITVAGIVFSLTMVTFTLASSQYGPRLLRNFMRDAGTQVVLGTFIATFIYCLIILRSVRSIEESVFVPHISVTVGLGFAMASLGLLIYFIHHVSASIEVETIVARIGSELLSVIRRIYPELEEGESTDTLSPPEIKRESDEKFTQDGHYIPSLHNGYIQTIDYPALVEIARDFDCVIRVEHPVRHFLAKGDPIVAVYPQKHIQNGLIHRINDAIVFGRHRTPTQDVEFAVDQLVEITLIALSSGINIPFTAMACIDRLGEGLSLLAERGNPSPYWYDNHTLRLIAEPVTFPDVVESAFNQIRQNMGHQVSVIIRLLEVIADIAHHVRLPEDKEALHLHATLIEQAARATIREAKDLKDIQERFRLAMNVLQAPERVSAHND